MKNRKTIGLPPYLTGCGLWYWASISATGAVVALCWAALGVACIAVLAILNR